MVKCQKIIDQVCRCWINKENEGYELLLNKLTNYLNDVSKRSWHSVPPPINRLQEESTDSWIDRMYKNWFNEEEESGF